MTCHQLSTLAPHYYHSCYHQRLQSIITMPTAHLSMQQLLWWVMLFVSTKPQTLTHAAYVSIFSAEHSSLLTQHIQPRDDSPLCQQLFCWTQTAISSATILLTLRAKNSKATVTDSYADEAYMAYITVPFSCSYHTNGTTTQDKNANTNPVSREYIKHLIPVESSVECVRACDKDLNAVAILQWKMSDWRCYPQASPLSLTDEEILENLNEIERICDQILNQQTSSSSTGW